MLKEIIDNQRCYADYFFNELNLQPIEQLLQLLLKNTGVIFFTGVGKSGFIARKIAYTLASTGTRAFYVSPIDALHGDLGMVSEQDLFIVLSKSGESDELLNLVPAIHNKRATVVSVVCNPHSRLAKISQLVIPLPFQKELCPFDMAPTMSTTYQLLFGDLVAVALMRYKNFSLDQYALNHPSGRIGKRISLKVKDLMLTGNRIPLCKPQDRLGEVLVELSNKRCGCVLVEDEKKLVGIFTDGDLRRTLQKVGSDVLTICMQEIMNTNPIAIEPDMLAWKAMQCMEENPQKRLTVLPVIDSQLKIIGIIHLHDIIQSGL